MDQPSKMFARAATLPSLARCLAVAAPLLLLGASSAEAAVPCVGAHASLDARLAVLAERGAAPLVQFVHRTHAIYQIDVAEALARVATYRRNVATCNAAADE